jgi:hypothetical protein
MAQIGTAAGFVTNGLLGTLTVTKLGDPTYAASADYSTIRATNLSAQFFSANGALLGTLTSLPNGGMITNYGGMITTGGAARSVVSPAQSLGDFGTNTNTISIGPTNLTNVHTFIIQPQGAPSNMMVTALHLTAFEVPSITITAAGYLPSAIGLSRSNQNLALQWFGTSALQQSFNLLNWSNLSGATSPYTAPISGTNRFFRLLQTNTF